MLLCFAGQFVLFANCTSEMHHRVAVKLSQFRVHSQEVVGGAAYSENTLITLLPSRL